MPTIYVDDREDNARNRVEMTMLLREIVQLSGTKLAITSKRLQYPHPEDRSRKIQAGDYCFMSPNGPDGLCSVGIERKRVRDMLGSMESGRYAGGQLPAMLHVYDFSFLIIEGWYRANPESLRLELPAGQRGGRTRWKEQVWGTRAMHFAALDSHLTTLRLHTPVQIIKTRTPQETAMEIFILWHHFASKKWDQHKSHLRFPAHVRPPGNVEPSFIRCVAKEIPGVAWERSKACEEIFLSGQDMFNADWERWAMIDGITPKRAREIVARIRARTRARGKVT
jgi:ERCC4-type nuclease